MSPFDPQPSSRDIAKIASKLAAAAQAVYDGWQQDADGIDQELGTGGICHLIAEAMLKAITDAYPTTENIATEHTTIGENHVYVVAGLADGVFEIDIPHSLYETGSGFNWRKRPGVQFKPSDVSLSCLSPDPQMFHRYVSDDLGLSI